MPWVGLPLRTRGLCGHFTTTSLLVVLSTAFVTVCLSILRSHGWVGIPVLLPDHLAWTAPQRPLCTCATTLHGCTSYLLGSIGCEHAVDIRAHLCIDIVLRCVSCHTCVVQPARKKSAKHPPTAKGWDLPVISATLSDVSTCYSICLSVCVVVVAFASIRT